MPYVMVPVPEEHVPDVMAHVLRVIQRAALKPWDEDDVAAVFADSDEPTRSLLSVVARATMMERRITESEASDQIQMSGRETSTIIRDVNERSREMSHPSLLLIHRVNETLPNGRAVELRVFDIGADLAKMIRKAEREIAADHHLIEDPQ